MAHLPELKPKCGGFGRGPGEEISRGQVKEEELPRPSGWLSVERSTCAPDAVMHSPSVDRGSRESSNETTGLTRSKVRPLPPLDFFFFEIL